MARDKNRTPADAGLDPTLAQKKRARHRLVGAVALCLLAALLIPLVLEAEPRQRVREVPLEIASRSKPVVSSAGSMSGVHASGSIGQRTPSAGVASAGTGGAPDRTPEPVAAARSTIVEVDDTRRGSPAARAAEKAAQDRAARERAAGAAPPSGQPNKPQDTSQARLHDNAAPEKAAQERAAKDKAMRERVATEKAAQERLSRERAAAREAAAKSAAATTPGKSAGAPKPTGDPIASLIDRSGALPPGTTTRSVGADAAKAGKEAARRYLIQIGAYSNIEGARNVSNRVMQAGLRPYQETIRTDKGEVIRVRVGPFQDRASAEDAQKSLKAAGVAAAIVAL